MGAMLFLHIAEDLDLLASQLFSPTQKFAGAAFNQSRAADVGEDVTFDTDKIEVGFAGDFERGFICSFEQLNPNRPLKTVSQFPSDLFQ